MAFTTPIGAYLSNQQAKKQQRAYNDIFSQQQAFLEQQQSLFKPYIQGGQAAMNPLQALITGQGQNGEQLSSAQRLGYFQQSPGYQFRLEEGQNRLNALAAARGRLFSGEQMKESERFGQGLASEEYGNYINQLSGLANTGLSAANSSANLGASFAPMLAQLQYGGAFNPFDKGAAGDNVIASMLNVAGMPMGMQGNLQGRSMTPSSPQNNYNSSSAFANQLSPYTSLSLGGGNY